MGTYCYTTEDGETVERRFRRARAPATITLEDGRIASRDYRAEHPPRRAGGGWPFICYASGVNAAQAGELREHLKRKGVPTEVTTDGDPVYRNATHRKEALAARGIHDRASFS